MNNAKAGRSRARRPTIWRLRRICSTTMRCSVGNCLIDAKKGDAEVGLIHAKAAREAAGIHHDTGVKPVEYPQRPNKHIERRTRCTQTASGR